MLKRFTTKELILIALFSAIIFVMELSLSAFGGTIPMVLFVSIVDAMAAILILLIIRKFGVLILASILVSTIALPTPAFGVPGVAKYLVLVPTAIVAEIVFFTLQKRKKLASIISGGLFVSTSSITYYLTARLLGLPSLQESGLSLFILIGFVIGAIGGILGYLLHNKLKNKQLIKQIQS